MSDGSGTIRAQLLQSCNLALIRTSARFRSGVGLIFGLVTR
jgi:hypothetical protein